eukprot:c7247_g1_i1 orf=2-166(-)
MWDDGQALLDGFWSSQYDGGLWADSAAPAIGSNSLEDTLQQRLQSVVENFAEKWT